MTVRVYDVGSLPSRADQEAINQGAGQFSTLLQLTGVGGESTRIFEEEVVKTTVDKLAAGVDIPNYPQLRDMNEMFLSLIRGVERVGGGYSTSSRLRVKPGASIPELEALRRNASRIADIAGVDQFEVKVCLTGPYTLSTLFLRRDERLLKE